MQDGVSKAGQACIGHAIFIALNAVSGILMPGYSIYLYFNSRSL